MGSDFVCLKLQLNKGNFSWRNMTKISQSVTRKIPSNATVTHNQTVKN